MNKNHVTSRHKTSCDYLEKAAEHFQRSIASFEALFDSLRHDVDRISIVDTYEVAYKLLAMAYKEDQPYQALLACERARARALCEILNIRYEIKSKTKMGSEIDVTDVEEIIAGCGFSVCFYALQPYSSVIYIWASSNGNPTYFTHSLMDEREKSNTSTETQGKTITTEITQGMSTITQEKSTMVNGKSAYTQATYSFTQITNMHEIMKAQLADLVNKAYDGLNVRAMEDYEDRSVTVQRSEEESEELPADNCLLTSNVNADSDVPQQIRNARKYTEENLTETQQISNQPNSDKNTQEQPVETQEQLWKRKIR